MSIHYSAEVAAALKSGAPIVALESTIISHGLPRPSNLSVAIEVEEIVRAHGAVPATIAILDGRIYVGLEADQLIEIAPRRRIGRSRCAGGRQHVHFFAAQQARIQAAEQSPFGLCNHDVAEQLASEVGVEVVEIATHLVPDGGGYDEMMLVLTDAIGGGLS